VEVLIEGERGKKVSDRPISVNAAKGIDLSGRTLMPRIDRCPHPSFLDLQEVVWVS
jgi:hypothetical protein